MLRDGTGDGGGANTTTLPATVLERLPSSLRDDDGYHVILLALADHEGSCSLSALTRTLVEETSWPQKGDEGGNPYQQVHIALVREHVPVLAEFGAIEYDEEIGTVRLPEETG